MKTLPTPGIIGPLITTYLSTSSDRDFKPLLKKFGPHITALAGTFPKDWQEDYFQEGSIGLYNALKGANPGMAISEFLLYATRAIRTRMIDFYRSTVGRFLIDVEVETMDGEIFTIKQPCIIQYPEYTQEDGEQISIIDNYTKMPEYASTLELGVDVQYFLSSKQLKLMKLTDQEVEVVNLHYKHDHNVSTVANFLHTSVSNASKLISKANSKIKPYLLNYHLNK